jgi:hypothetical protein
MPSSSIDPEVLSWFEEQRGIKPETLERFGVTQEGEWLNFNYSQGSKMRSLPTLEGSRKFRFSPGIKPGLYSAPGTELGKTAFIVEGETDAMRLFQELDGRVAVFGLGGVTTWRPELAEPFKDCTTVYVVLDNDLDYNVMATVDNCWRSIRQSLGLKARRVVLPPGSKDICEFFQNYNLDSFRALCKRAMGGTRRFKDLDLSAQPPVTDWLVEGVLAAGDVTLLMGDPGLGKSWLTMSLATAVANGDDEWLNKAVHKQGPVLYIDEENPLDLIYSRFKRLGLTEEGVKNLHYLYRPGVWVNKDPDAFYEEAVAIEPALIVIDSLSRIHNEDENSSSAMGRLFREGIVPMARETGASVIVIHHSVKGSGLSSYQRSRGSGDITAVVDAAIDCSPFSDKIKMYLYKSRRQASGTIAYVDIIDDIDERGEEIVRLDVGNHNVEYSF